MQLKATIPLFKTSLTLYAHQPSQSSLRGLYEVRSPYRAMYPFFCNESILKRLEQQFLSKNRDFWRHIQQNLFDFVFSTNEVQKKQENSGFQVWQPQQSLGRACELSYLQTTTSLARALR